MIISSITQSLSLLLLIIMNIYMELHFGFFCFIQRACNIHKYRNSMNYLYYSNQPQILILPTISLNIQHYFKPFNCYFSTFFVFFVDDSPIIYIFFISFEFAINGLNTCWERKIFFLDSVFWKFILFH